MIKNKIWINGTLLNPFGRQFTEAEDLRGVREDTAADGTLRRDIVARKKVFTMSYDVVEWSDVEWFTELLISATPIKLEIERPTRKDTYFVLLQPFTRDRVSYGMYEGLTLEFVEV